MPIPRGFRHTHLIQISIPSCTRLTLRISAMRIQYILKEKYCLLKESRLEVSNILRSGIATSSISSHEGRVVILRIALAGDVLGLNSVLRISSYNTTVKTIEPCCTDFISRVDLVKLVDRSKPATCAILKILSQELTELADRTTSLLLPKTAVARLAQLLLEWCEESGGNNSRIVQIHKNFTQEEIGQMICSSRETVTRLLAMLSRRQIVQITADRIVIQDRPALQNLALR